MTVASHALPLSALLLGGLLLASCSSEAPPPPQDLPAAVPALPAAPSPSPVAVPAAPPATGSFHLVTDQDRSRITWTARAGGKEYSGAVSLVVGGFYLKDDDLDGASGSIAANLRYIETGRPMWDQRISESFFEALQPAGEKAHGTVSAIRLAGGTAAGGERRGEARVDLIFARGSREFILPVSVTRDGSARVLRSLAPAVLDLRSVGYGDRLADLESALGIADIEAEVRFEFELHLHPLSAQETARSVP